METARLFETDSTSNWRVVGAAVQGLSHQNLDLPCQDAIGFRRLPGNFLIVALADGAGTAERSDLAARCAVEAGLESLETLLSANLPEEEESWEALLLTAFEAARQALLFLAEQSDEPLRAYATTLTCAVATGERLVIGQLGDGAVVARSAAGEYYTATQSQRGEYANETYFLTQEDALEQVAIRVIAEPGSALAVMSDGLTRLALKMPALEPHPPFFQPLFAFVEASNGGEDRAEAALADFLASERVCARTDDDKSLVLAVLQVE